MLFEVVVVVPFPAGVVVAEVGWAASGAEVWATTTVFDVLDVFGVMATIADTAAAPSVTISSVNITSSSSAAAEDGSIADDFGAATTVKSAADRMEDAAVVVLDIVLLHRAIAAWSLLVGMWRAADSPPPESS